MDSRRKRFPYELEKFILFGYSITTMVTKYVRKQNNFRTKKTYGKKKRWYFNAQANLPFVGATKVGFGTGMQKRSIVNLVRRRLEDTCHKLWSKVGAAPPSVGMTHNSIYAINLCGNISKGDDESDRTGESIHLDALKFRCHFVSQSGSVTNGNRPKTYRVMIIKHDNDWLGGSDSFCSGPGATDLFHGNNNPVWEWTAAKNVTVLYDKKIKINPQLSTEVYDNALEDIIKFNSTFTYKPDQNYGKFHNYYLCVMGYEPAGSSGTTAIGTCYFHGDLIFKDSK